MDKLEKVFGGRKDEISPEQLKRWQNASRKNNLLLRKLFVLHEDLTTTVEDNDCLEKPDALCVKTYLVLKLNITQAAAADLLRKTLTETKPKSIITWEHLSGQETWTPKKKTRE